MLQKHSEKDKIEMCGHSIYTESRHKFEESGQRFFGFHWFGKNSVSSQIDCYGNEIESYYNLSDFTGSHDCKETNDPEILAGREKSLEDARNALAYAKARYKETSIENLQYAYLVIKSNRQHTIYVDKSNNTSETISGYGLSKEELEEIDRLGIPLIDTTSMPLENFRFVFSFPMPQRKVGISDEPPYGSLSYAPIAIIAALYQTIGATIKHITPDYSGVKDCKCYETILNKKS